MEEEWQQHERSTSTSSVSDPFGIPSASSTAYELITFPLGRAMRRLRDAMCF